MNWHALEGSLKRQYIKIAFHIPIPDINNEVGERYRDALMAEEPFTSSVAPNVSAEEIAELGIAAKIEIVKVVYFNANLTISQKVAIIDAKYSSLVVSKQLAVQNKYCYWGYAKDVG